MLVYGTWIKIYYASCSRTYSISGNLLQSLLVNNKPLRAPAFVRLIYSGKMNILSFMCQIYGLLLSVRMSEVKPNSWWRHQMETFSVLLAFCAGNSPDPGEFPSQRPVAWSFDVFLICAWINGWVNNGEASDLRRHRAHYDVTVMYSSDSSK